ncbi:DUF84 family protein [Desulfoplanes sp.]
MRIVLGSLNPVKLQATQEVLATIPCFSKASVTPAGVASMVSDQPIGLDETITGARNRAKGAFALGDIGIGLESGLVQVDMAPTGYMNLTACVIVDSVSIYTGLGPAFELPITVTRAVVEQGMELDEAVRGSGLSEDPRIGYKQGIIGILTKGRVTRMEYTKPAIMMALAGMDV